MKRIEELPFFYKAQIRPGNGNFPETFPFDLYFDQELRMFRQKATDPLRRIMNEVYLQGSLVEGSVSSESGIVYISKIIDYLFFNFKFEESSNVLEIGYGSGVLLKELHSRGIKYLTGIEPGIHPKVEGLEEVRLINDFFPSKTLNEPVDIIYSFGILEHIEDPVTFLKEQKNLIVNNGKIIFGVPNCEPYLAVGDISVFIHEHYNYFTIESIFAVVKAAGLFVNDISIVEGSFLVTLGREDIKFKFDHFNFQEINFYKKLDENLIQLLKLFEKFPEESISIYSPVRAMNVLFLIGKNKVRLVDDNSELHDRYLPKFKNKIESYDVMVKCPPRCLLIFSRTFGARIKAKCISDDRLASTTIITLEEIDI
jgi:cyclopropane-fatty-acyl-phospholipid synthase